MNNSNQIRNDIEKKAKKNYANHNQQDQSKKEKNHVKVERLISTCSTCQQNTTRRDLLRIIQT